MNENLTSFDIDHNNKVIKKRLPDKEKYILKVKTNRNDLWSNSDTDQENSATYKSPVQKPNKNLRAVEMLLCEFNENDDNFDNLMRQLDSIRSPNNEKSSIKIDFLNENTEEIKNNVSANENTIEDIDRMLNDFPVSHSRRKVDEDDIMSVSPNKNSFLNLKINIETLGGIQKEDSVISDFERYASMMLKQNKDIGRESRNEYNDDSINYKVNNEIYCCSINNQPSEETLTNRKLNNEFKPYGVFLKKSEASSPPVKYYARTNLLLYSGGDRRLEAEIIKNDPKNKRFNLK